MRRITRVLRRFPSVLTPHAKVNAETGRQLQSRMDHLHRPGPADRSASLRWLTPEDPTEDTAGIFLSMVLVFQRADTIGAFDTLGCWFIGRGSGHIRVCWGVCGFSGPRWIYITYAGSVWMCGSAGRSIVVLAPTPRRVELPTTHKSGNKPHRFTRGFSAQRTTYRQ